jgi:radical SAM protein with 4Fe4S-binding SPASM domain
MKEEVKKAYKKIATGESCCLPEESCCTADLSAYSQYLSKLPKDLNFKSLGCGAPLAFELLGEGERVLDIGSGEGLEAIIAATMVGEDGLVVGLDFTDEMLEKARENGRKCGLGNIKFVKGEAEKIPFSDGYFDTVISNCVLNLVEDKERAIKEIFRVLKPGGRVLISDIVSERELPEEIRNDPELWSSCIGGALPFEEYIGIFEKAGFSMPRIFEQKEIRFGSFKLFSITFKAVKFPSQVKVEAEEVEKGIFLFPSQPAWAVGDEEHSVYLEKLVEGVERKDLLEEEGNITRELVDEFAFRQLIFSEGKTREYKGRREVKPVLKEVWLHLNQKCNLRCRYCLVDAGREVGEPLRREEIKSVLEEASSLGAKRFYLTGGEPYLLKDYKEIFELIMSFGELVILTNATLIDENSYIPSPEKALFQVSLDGTERVNDLLRGKGSFKRALRGIKVLQEGGHQPVVASVVTKVNLYDLPNLTLLLGDLGLSHHHLLFLHQRGRAKKEKLTPPVDKVLKCMERMIEAGKKAGVALDNYLAFAARLRSFQGEKKDLCHAGVEMIALGPEGEVYPCPSLVGEEEFVLGNVREGNLKNIWENSLKLKEMREVSLKDCSKCQTCEFRFYCGGGCLAFKFLESGSFSGEDPYCEIYKYFMIKKLKEWRREKILLSPYSIPLGKDEVSVFNCA